MKSVEQQLVVSASNVKRALKFDPFDFSASAYYEWLFMMNEHPELCISPEPQEDY